MALFKKKQAAENADFALNTDLIGFDEASKLKDLVPTRRDDKTREAISHRLGVDMEVELQDAEMQRAAIGLSTPVDENSDEFKERKMVENVTLVTEMSEVERRITYEAITRIERLMFNIRSKQDNVEDFLEFARESSNTEMSISFMESLYYYTQSTKDTNVIVELANLSGQEMFSMVDEIINLKYKRIENIPMLVVMIMLIPLFGVLISFMVNVAINAFSGLF